MSDELAIELRDVTCLRTEAGVQARVEDVSLAVEPGTMTLLTGEAGCGKNLLLRLLGLLETPGSGEVFFEGQPTAQLTDDARADLRSRRCGYLFSAPFLLRTFSTLENIAMPMFKISQVAPVDAQQRTEELLAFTGLTEFAQARDLPDALQHRVALARALANEPAVLFVENLDSLLAADELPGFRRLLQAAAQRYRVAVVASALPSIGAEENERRLAVSGGRVLCEVTP